MKALLLALVCCFASLLPAAALDANLSDGCAEDYAADVDYFPQKTEIVDAARFSVEYHNNYKIVSVADAYDDAPNYTYVLVQCGTPPPPADDFADGAQFIDVPAGALVTLSTSQLPPLAQLGLLENLVAVDSGFYVSSPEVVRLIAAGEVAEVGFGAQVNIELVLELAPDLVMSYGLNPATDAHPILLEAGVFTALDASWREHSPLGRAEWLKFAALFYNQEAAANELYGGIVERYEAVKALAAAVAPEDQPAVLLNSFLGYADAWFIPGADTYVGRLISDAGGQLLLSQAGSDASHGLSFEAVYVQRLDADLWLVETFGIGAAADLLALDSRFGDFAAFQAGALWNNNRDENVNGGNNYYELGVTSPHLVLADLLAIFHPDLMPDHDFAFYQPLASD